MENLSHHSVEKKKKEKEKIEIILLNKKDLRRTH